MKPPTRRYFTITGIDGITVWPSSNIVVNTAPVSDVIIDNLPTENFFAVNVRNHGSVVDTIAMVDGVITLPAALFADAFNNRVTLELLRDSVTYRGIISFLPQTESEDFPMGGYLNDQGTFVPYANCACTDFCNIEDVVDIVYTGRMVNKGRSLVAYDANKSFVRILLGIGEWDSSHIVPDGSYAYVRACSLNTVDYSLELHYRRRRR